MRRPKTLPALTDAERVKAHQLLAVRVAYMMGRKFEEGDWADVYCGAKNIPKKGWSNLNIDITHGLLGVEHKMLCYRSRADLREACGTSLMHPAATRSIRTPPTSTPPDVAMRDILNQYGALIQDRAAKVKEASGLPGNPDMRVGWLLWQESLRQFMYFEEEMLAPNPDDYRAEWVDSGGGTRKKSRNLWIYETETGKKRYSVTTEAGAKVQPYFDVPPPTDPNLYRFVVIGEQIDSGLVRVWVTESTYEELRRVVGDLAPERLSAKVLQTMSMFSDSDSLGDITAEKGRPLLLTAEAYTALTTAVGGANDDHSLRLFARHLQRAH